MCDYSLELYRSRPAIVGEALTLHRFQSGTMGFAATQNVPATAGNTIKAIVDGDCALCVKEGAKLELEGISEIVQRQLDIGATEKVTMIRLEGSKHVHKDGVRFANGREILLQSLNAGLTAKLLPADYTGQVQGIAQSIAEDDATETGFIAARETAPA